MFFNNKNENNIDNFGNHRVNYNLTNNNDNKGKFKTIFSSYKKIFFFVLSILCIFAITRINYIGGSFLDSFVFGMLFGYFRYAFYLWVFISFICLVFNFQHKIKIRRWTRWFLIFILLSCSWFQAISYSNITFWGSRHNGFLEIWKNFGHQLSVAFKNISNNGVFNGDYDSMPSGIVGILIVSCFFAIPNPGAAQSIFWIFTITVALVIIAYVFLNDLKYIINLIKYIFTRIFYSINELWRWFVYRFRLLVVKNNNTSKNIDTKGIKFYTEKIKKEKEGAEDDFKIINDLHTTKDLTFDAEEIKSNLKGTELSNTKEFQKIYNKNNNSHTNSKEDIERSYREFCKQQKEKEKNLYTNLKDSVQKDNSLIGGISETIKIINIKKSENKTPDDKD